MKEINARLSELSTVFGQNLLKETNGFELVVAEAADLAGPAGQHDRLGAGEGRSRRAWTTPGCSVWTAAPSKAS